VKEGIWWRYFVVMYENRTMKPVESVLRSEEGQKRRRMERVDLIKTYCNPLCSCHKVSPV
jgi:hypothetical protein